ncbi:MAG: TRAP transporter small permease [Synergistales bacterium]|nr:TRAP transporter small permease [Synergistales bacterium]
MMFSGSQGEKGLERWITRLETLSAWTACFMLAVNVGDILLGVFCRYVLKSSLIWTEEVARFSLVWIVMLGALGAAVRGDHMTVDFVVPRFPQYLQRAVELGRFLLSVAILILMICLGWVNATRIWHMKTLALNIPKTFPLMALPAGFALLLAGTVLLYLRGRES